MKTRRPIAHTRYRGVGIGGIQQSSLWRCARPTVFLLYIQRCFAPLSTRWIRTERRLRDRPTRLRHSAQSGATLRTGRCLSAVSGATLRTGWCLSAQRGATWRAGKASQPRAVLLGGQDDVPQRREVLLGGYSETKIHIVLSKLKKQWHRKL